MLVNITHDTKAEHRRLLLAGVVFVTVMAMLVGLSIAVYRKAFTPVTMVTVKADRAGLQLAQFGDVRLHGALVGQVRGISQDGKEASIRIGLRPDSATKIPENIKVEILPTTLFGQKYIALVDPDEPSSKALSDGDVIPSSRVRTNVELSTILANLFPLLRSIRPADLSTTLYALANALRGRGDQLGETMVKLDSYLTDINVHLPTLKQDLVLLASVSKTYALAAPDLVRLLRNATTTARTVTTKEAELRGFFKDVTGLGKTSTRVLRTNERAIVREAALARPLLKLLDTYSPEFPCLLQGSAKYSKNLNDIFDTGRVEQTMSFAAKQRPPYGVQDRPEYGETGHGPWCLGLPNPPVPIGANPLKDGTDSDNPGFGE
jgi:phospholipid/cholesterol/gamma-HCH transport system substrate-binding protein